MKIAFLALGAIAGATLGVTVAHAQNYPWCAYYGGPDGARNCGFETFAQCQADISGIGGSCQRNTQYQPEPQKRRAHPY